MREVIKEIESHNGIIQESTNNQFEFSHLSIQEYLCAEFLVKLPYSQSTIDYFYQNPEPVAIAICISGSPGEWLANLILNSNMSITSQARTRGGGKLFRSLSTLITRLLVESPSFNISKELGYTMIFLIFTYLHEETPLSDKILELLSIEKVRKSTSLALQDYRFIKPRHADDSYRHLKRTQVHKTSYFIKLPLKGKIPKELYDLIVD